MATNHDQLMKELIAAFPGQFVCLAAPEVAERIQLAALAFEPEEHYAGSPTGHARRGDLIARAPVRLTFRAHWHRHWLPFHLEWHRSRKMWLGGPGITAWPDKERPQPMNVLTETRLWALDTVSGRALSAGSEECLKSVPQARVRGRDRVVATVRECAVCGGGRPVATGGGVGMSVW